MSRRVAEKMNVAVLGSSSHGAVIADAIERSTSLRLLGFLDGKRELGEKVCGYKILGQVEDIPTLMRRHKLGGLVIGIGDNWVRAREVKAVRAVSPRIRFPNLLHPSAVVASRVSWGEGNVVLAGCVVNCGTTIGDFCVLNTSCSIDHDCRLGDYVSVAPQACAGGNVEIGDYSAICLGARIIHRIRIGAHSVIGAGSTVLRHVPSRVTAYGTPARIIRSRKIGDVYLATATEECEGAFVQRKRLSKNRKASGGRGP
jgi:sugar O-acyltransferase (sialic acid O-acetyltransferase NeuD family)